MSSNSVQEQRISSALKEAAQRIKEYEAREREPIAVLAVSCRLPGEVNSLHDLWNALQHKRITAQDIPPERFSTAELYSDDREKPGTLYTRRASLLKDVAGFDAPFFSISPREARMMDPQQRLLLELSWETLERAAISPDSLKASRTGVFVGAMTDDYIHRVISPEEFDPHTASGNLGSSLAGRISFFYGCRGPSVVVNTACSSSLVAVHQAAQSLRSRECDLAFVGGVNVIASATYFLAECRAQMLSPDGRCKTFDASADGYGRGEGAVVLLLKRLSDAVQSGDPICAVVRGTAVNHDGKTSGMTVPSGEAQQEVILTALKQANFQPTDIGYIEAHGTGTPLGDPIEVHALGAVFSEKTHDDPLYVSSIKSNLGHLEGAAGVAGVAKVIACINNKAIAPHAELLSPNPKIAWSALPITIPLNTIPWSDDKGRLRAGVSSFGFSGTNAHVILEEYRSEESTNPPARCDVLTLSARTKRSLQMLLERYRTFLSQHAGASLASIFFTANTTRKIFAHRAAVWGETTEELHHALTDLLETGSSTHGCLGVAQDSLVGEVHVTEPSSPKNTAECERLAAAFTSGKSVIWDKWYEGTSPARTVLPTYPFEHERFWIDREEAATALGESDKSIVDAYYSALSAADATLEYERERDERFLTFGPLPEKVPGFSFFLVQAYPEKYPEFAELIVSAQKEMRSLLFQHVDFSRVRRIADIGCGYGSDLRRLALEYPHVEGIGYTIAAGQAAVAQAKIAELKLSDRLRVFHRDSSKDPFPGTFDLMIGFEVVHHVPDKMALFSQVKRHLNPGGKLLLADFVARTNFSIDHDETSSFFNTVEQWVDLLGSHNLILSQVIDISPEVANFLYDENFEIHIQKVKETNDSGHVENALRSYYQLGKLFSRNLASYALLSVTHAREGSARERDESNRKLLTEPMSYTESAPRQWFYQVGWEEVESLPISSQSSRRTLIITDHSEASLLFGETPTRGVEESASIQRWLSENRDGNVVCCFEHKQSSPKQLAAHLQFLQSLLTQNSEWKGAVTLLTCGSVTTTNGEEVSNPFGTALWSFLRATREELIGQLVVSVDLQRLDPATISRVLELDTRALTTWEFAVRDDRWKTSVLTRASIPEVPIPPPQPKETVLITGGLGGVGVAVARHLIALGATDIAVVSRRKGVAEEVSSSFADITELARVHPFCADVASDSDMRWIFSTMAEQGKPIARIIHCAGVLDDAPLADYTEERIAKILKPKVEGALVLSSLAAEFSVKQITYTGSMTALVGGAGQAPYAAANGFLEGISKVANQSCTSRCIHFGPWAGAGMVSEALEARYKRKGITSSSAEALVKVTERLATSAQNGVGVLQVDWKRFLVNYIKTDHSLLRDFAKGMSSSGENKTVTGSSLSIELTRADAGKRARMISHLVRKETATVLGLHEEGIGTREGFFDLGMDSLLSVELRNKLQAHFEFELPQTLTFSYPSIEEVAHFLNSEFSSHNTATLPLHTDISPNNDDLLTKLEEAISALRKTLGRVS